MLITGESIWGRLQGTGVCVGVCTNKGLSVQALGLSPSGFWLVRASGHGLE